jgi:hypothetical protein
MSAGREKQKRMMEIFKNDDNERKKGPSGLDDGVTPTDGYLNAPKALRKSRAS